MDSSPTSASQCYFRARAVLPSEPEREEQRVRVHFPDRQEFFKSQVSRTKLRREVSLPAQGWGPEELGSARGIPPQGVLAGVRWGPVPGGEARPLGPESRWSPPPAQPTWGPLSPSIPKAPEAPGRLRGGSCGLTGLMPSPKDGWRAGATTCWLTEPGDRGVVPGLGVAGGLREGTRFRRELRVQNGDKYMQRETRS